MHRWMSALGALSLFACAAPAGCGASSGAGGCGDKPLGTVCRTASGACVDLICASGQWDCAAGQARVAPSPTTCSSGRSSSGGVYSMGSTSSSGGGSGSDSAACPTATWERPPACDGAECPCDAVCADGPGRCGASTLTATCGTTCRGTYTTWVPSPRSCDADADCVPRCMGWVCKDHECRRPDGGCTNDAQCPCGSFCVIGGGSCVTTGRLAP